MIRKSEKISWESCPAIKNRHLRKSSTPKGLEWLVLHPYDVSILGEVYTQALCFVSKTLQMLLSFLMFNACGSNNWLLCSRIWSVKNNSLIQLELPFYKSTWLNIGSHLKDISKQMETRPPALTLDLTAEGSMASHLPLQLNFQEACRHIPCERHASVPRPYLRVPSIQGPS